MISHHIQIRLFTAGENQENHQINTETLHRGLKSLPLLSLPASRLHSVTMEIRLRHSRRDLIPLAYRVGASAVWDADLKGLSPIIYPLPGP